MLVFCFDGCSFSLLLPMPQWPKQFCFCMCSLNWEDFGDVIGRTSWKKSKLFLMCTSYFIFLSPLTISDWLQCPVTSSAYHILKTGAIYIYGILPSKPLIDLVFRCGSLTVSFSPIHFYHYFNRSVKNTGYNIYARSEVVFWFGQIAKEMFRDLAFTQSSTAFISSQLKVNVTCKLFMWRSLIFSLEVYVDTQFSIVIL